MMSGGSSGPETRGRAARFPVQRATRQGPADSASEAPMPFRSDCRDGARSCAPEDGSELRLRAFQDATLLRGHVLSGAVQIEGEHRHGRLVGGSLAPRARLGGALEGERDPTRIALSEDAALAIERIAPPRDLARPIAGTFSSCSGSFRRRHALGITSSSAPRNTCDRNARGRGSPARSRVVLTLPSTRPHDRRRATAHPRGT